MLRPYRIRVLNMLLTIRRKSQGWVAWLIVIIIAVPFALFGINSYFEGANQIPVAKVNGDNIDAQTFENAMEQRRRFFRSQLGNNFDPAMVDNPQFRMQVVEGLERVGQDGGACRRREVLVQGDDSQLAGEAPQQEVELLVRGEVPHQAGAAVQLEVLGLLKHDVGLCPLFQGDLVGVDLPCRQLARDKACVLSLDGDGLDRDPRIDPDGTAR